MDHNIVAKFIRKQKVAFICSVDEEGFPNVKAMLKPRKTNGLHTFWFGSLNGKCVTRAESGEIDGSLLAVEVLLLGNENSSFVVTGGNIHLAQDSDHTPVSPAGTPLCFGNPSKDHYEATFRDGDEEWTYKADRNENGYLGVWILL